MRYTTSHCVRATALSFILVLGLSPTVPAFDRDRIPDPGDPGPIDLGVELHTLSIAGEVLEGMMESLLQNEIDVALVGGESYKVNDCLGVEFSAGEFELRWDKPTFQIDADGIEIAFEVEHVELNAFRIRIRVPDPTWTNPLNCSWGGSFGVGGSASNVRFSFRFRPRVRLDDCQMVSLGSWDARLSIGSLNLSPLINELDNVAKNIIEDVATAALDQLLPNMIGEALSGSILARICQTKVYLYELYMAFLGTGVRLHSLPEEYVQKLQPLYPTVDLRTVKFGYSGRQEPGNATTDCNRIYFSDPGFVDRLRTATVAADDDAMWSWLLHELQHTEQCRELGGREEFAKRWFKDFSVAALVTNLNSPAYFRVLHDNMPMEQDAMAIEKRSTVVIGTVQKVLEPVAGAEVTVYPAGAAVGSGSVPVTRAVSSPGLPHSPKGECLLFLEPGTYDVYVDVHDPASPGAKLAKEDLVLDAADAGDDGTCDLEYLNLSSALSPIRAEEFIRGNANDEGGVDISDALYCLSWLFTGGEAPPCEKAADVNDDGSLDISDPLGLLGFLFLGGEEPPPPFREEGGDPTGDDLTCRLPDGPQP